VREAVWALVPLPPPVRPDRADDVEASVLERIRPPPEMLARVDAVGQQLVERAREAAARHGYPLVRCLVAGSAARGTFLRDRLDLDFFLLFPPTLPREQLEEMGLALGEEILRATETRYAEHPYRRGRFEEFVVDAVPGYAIDDPREPLTAVDRTPFHNEYLRAHQTPEMVEQVRLTKQFLRGLDVYGSEARRGGFSGYLVELLVLRFGTLRRLLDDARSWRIPTRFLSRPGVAPRVPDDVALVLDDPVDPARNVATALTRRNLALFILAAREYLVRPSLAAFEPPARLVPSRAEAERLVSERATHVTSLTLARPGVVDDILYPQLRKAERAMAEEAARLGFAVIGTASAAGEREVIVLLEVDRPRLSSVRVQDGPPAGIDRSGEFLEKWTQPSRPVLQGPYVGADGHLVVEVRRDERGVEPLLTATLGWLPLGRDLRERLLPSARFQTLSELPDRPEVAEALADLLTKRLPWAPRTSASERGP
jgi:tRNA nucleotidyltransferase (CCA-adding enzyme)